MTRTRPPEQLDIPLVWEVERAPATGTGGRGPDERFRPVGLSRVLLAAALDLGALLSALGAACATVLLAGARLPGPSLAIAAGVGLELVSIVAVACLWAWRGTPGQLLAGFGLARPLRLETALVVWLVWLAALPAAATPLLVPLRGARLMERLAGAPLRFR